MLRFCALFFISGVMALESYAAPVCSNASILERNTKKVNLIKEMPPIKDQDSIGWCYGFAASDLLTHYLHKSKGRNVKGNVDWADYRLKAFSVSPMAIASMYNQGKKSDYSSMLKNRSVLELERLKMKVVAEGGTISGALEVAKERGFCYERDVSSEDFSYVNDYRCAVKNHCNIGEILNIVYESPKSKIGCNDLFTIQKVFPALNINSIKNVLVRSAKQDALANLVNLSCKKKFTNSFMTDHPRFSTRTIKIGEPSGELMSFLDNRLDRGIPVGVMYYADFLTGGTGKNFAHASSIVGKAFNPATCEVEYILRNSWGRGCGYYMKENPGYPKCFKAAANFEAQAACRRQYKSIPRNPRVRCEDPSGYLYIRKSELKNQIYNVTAIEEDSIF